MRIIIDALVSIAFHSFTSIRSNFHNSYRTFPNREIKPDLEASEFKVIPPYSKFKKQKEKHWRVWEHYYYLTGVLNFLHFWLHTRAICSGTGPIITLITPHCCGMVGRSAWRMWLLNQMFLFSSLWITSTTTVRNLYFGPVLLNRLC